MSSSKKLKMERLSPIPMMDRARANLSDSCQTPTWRVTPNGTARKRKDRYAIESTSSPEVDLQPNLSRKLKRTRNSAVRQRTKSQSKNLASTPLSGLIARKSVGHLSKELPHPCSELNFGSRKVQLDTIEEMDNVDDEIVAEPVIGAFQSPLKPKVVNQICHAERLTPSIVFPSLPPSSGTTNSTLSGIITKTSFGLNRSLNDSVSILANADTDICDDKAPEHYDSPPIESYESPQKPPLSLDKDTFDVSCLSFIKPSVSNLALRCSSEQPLVEYLKGNTSQFDGNVDMGGSLRKRKRALDFSSQSLPPKDHLDSPTSFNEIRPLVLLRPPDMECESPSQQNEFLNGSSDADSVVEGTPKACRVRPVIEDETLSGFKICSSLEIVSGSPPNEYIKDCAPITEHNSPPSPQFKIGILEEASNDAFPEPKCNLNLVCQDTSSDESEVECSINEIDDETCVVPNAPSVRNATQSPPLNFNCTKREIRPYESPSKATKAFSEAIEIGVFGSPDSTASNVEEDEVVKESEGDDIINVSTTLEEEEFVDESEQIRPSKRRKKGSLLERAGFIISRIDASQVLFDYEIKAGLRPSSGKFVSSPLVVCKLWAGENSDRFLICKSLKSCKTDPEELSEAKHVSIVVIIVNKTLNEFFEGSVVLLHYPLTAVYCDNLRIPYILAGNQLVSASNVPNVTDSHALHIDELTFTHPVRNPASSLMVFPISGIKNLEEAVLCQCLVDEFQLSLRVLHVIKVSSGPSSKQVLVLCRDLDKNVGWIKFTQERNVKRATALETLSILSHGTLVHVKGFHVTTKHVLDKKTKNLLSYCLNENVENNEIFTLVPIESTWVISSSGGPKDAQKLPVSIGNILTQKAHGKRFLIEVASTKLVEDQNVLLTDSLGGSVNFIQGQLSPKFRFELLSAPFFLDGVYYYNGQIFSDEYTKLFPEKLPWAKL